MNKIEIKEKLSEIFIMVMGENAVDITNINEQSRLVDDIGLNSVGILYLVIAIEEFFNIRFEDIGTSDLKTIGQVIEYIDSKVQ